VEIVSVIPYQWSYGISINQLIIILVLLAFQYGGSTGSLSRASSQRLMRQDSMPTQLTQLSRQPSLSGGAASLSGQPVPRPASRSSDGFSRQSSFRRDADHGFSDSNAFFELNLLGYSSWSFVNWWKKVAKIL
jgi:hypothetical protein